MRPAKVIASKTTPKNPFLSGTRLIRKADRWRLYKNYVVSEGKYKMNSGTEIERENCHVAAVCVFVDVVTKNNY